MVTAAASFLGALFGAWVGCRAARVYGQANKDLGAAAQVAQFIEPVLRKARPKGGKLKPKIQDDRAAWKREQEKD